MAETDQNQPKPTNLPKLTKTDQSYLKPAQTNQNPDQSNLTWLQPGVTQPGNLAKKSNLPIWQKFLPGNLAPNSYLATWQPGKSSNLDYLAVAATWPEGSCCCQVENTRRVARLENLPGCRVAGDSIESRVGKLGQGAFCQVGGLLAPRSNLARFWQPGCRVAGLRFDWSVTGYFCSVQTLDSALRCSRPVCQECQLARSTGDNRF